MFYFTGDTHGDLNRFAYHAAYDGEESWSAGDYLFICGDFGYLSADDPRKEAFLDQLATRPYTICFCDGNHENFDLLESLPVEEWKGGTVHRIRPNILHLMRGQIYEIDGRTVFAMGGAYSVDRETRAEGKSWWRREIPAKEEIALATQNLMSRGNRVDFILTHTAPREVIDLMEPEYDPHDADLTAFLDRVRRSVDFRHWFFGHWHMDKNFGSRIHGLNFGVVSIDPAQEV